MLFAEQLQALPVVPGWKMDTRAVPPQIIDEVDWLEREAEEAHAAFLAEARRLYGG